MKTEHLAAYAFSVVTGAGFLAAVILAIVGTMNVAKRLLSRLKLLLPKAGY